MCQCRDVHSPASQSKGRNSRTSFGGNLPRLSDVGFVLHLNMYIKDQESLRALYGWPKGRARAKVLDKLEKHAIHFIQHSPFIVLSTFSENGQCDASPRGGKPGFVHISDPNTLLLPDAKGNNRVDSLVNIVETGRVGMIFLIPGIDETLRVNGAGRISTASSHLDLFSEAKNPPKSCIKITIEEVFLHCAKAFMRSQLWTNKYKQTRPGFPTMGTMLNEQLGLQREEESQEEMVQRYLPDL